MTSSYRLCDLVLLNLNETNAILRDYPNSIGVKYIHNINNNSYNTIDIITQIVLDYITHITHINDFLPKDINTFKIRGCCCWKRVA